MDGPTGEQVSESEGGREGGSRVINPSQFKHSFADEVEQIVVQGEQDCMWGDWFV